MDLNLSFNQIENIASLASLKKLQTLKLQENRIKTIDALSGLTTLTTLELSTNQISNVSPISTLTGLTSLGLRSNKLTTLQSLNNVTKLTDLDAGSNQITDVTPLANKLQLTRLILAENRIRDFSPLSALINITFLSIADNLATDYSFMAGYPANGTYFTESTELIDENIPKTEIISRYATLVSDLTTVVNNIKSQTNDSSQQLDRLYQTMGERLEFNYETEKYRNVNLYEVYYSKKTICYGYAKLFALGAQLLGYDAIVISGEITDSKTAHAWTLVKIDGQWRHFDLTWDDAGASLVNRIYYNKSDDFMKNDVSAGKRAWEYDEYPI
jgi:transglutaminase/protease-like cytokinesis protein 3